MDSAVAEGRCIMEITDETLLHKISQDEIEEAVRMLDNETSADAIREIEERGENVMERVNEACKMGAEALRHILFLRRMARPGYNVVEFEESR